MASFRPEDDENPDDGVVAEINITPLTDVFLVLLVIFMVTTSVVANQSKNIDLPGADVSDTTPTGFSVMVSPDGTIEVDDQVDQPLSSWSGDTVRDRDGHIEVIRLHAQRQVRLAREGGALRPA